MFNCYLRQILPFETLSNGVKQGGVLSTFLFSMYIDPLIVELGKFDFVCHLFGFTHGLYLMLMA